MMHGFAGAVPGSNAKFLTQPTGRGRAASGQAGGGQAQCAQVLSRTPPPSRQCGSLDLDKGHAYAQGPRSG
jgi:hypothetical protein